MNRLAYAGLALAVVFGVAATAVRTQSASQTHALAVSALTNDLGAPVPRESPNVFALANNSPTGLVTREELIAERLQRYGIDNPDPAPVRPQSRMDSLAWERHRRMAARIPGRKVIVSVYDRRLWLIDGQDTLLNVAAGVGMGTAQRGNRTYEFSSPRGLRRILSKEADPLWVPPDWHYLEMSDRVRHFPSRGIPLADGGTVIRRGKHLGILRGNVFEELAPEHPLVFDGTMYIPPVGTVNRQIPEILGKFKLDTGEGILIHGTNDPLSVGLPVTHGCIRLAEEPLRQLYQAVNAGTPVYIY